MKCKLCKKKTTVDSSFGKENFIVCDICFYRLVSKMNLPFPRDCEKIMNIIFEISKIIEERN